MLDATIMRGENKDEPTRSILNVVPTKNDDGASYRCTVWNRALRQEHSLEAGTKIYVNCKYIKIGTTHQGQGVSRNNLRGTFLC